MLAAVKISGHYNFQYASDNLRTDKDVVLATVQDHGTVLHHASPEFRANREVVLAAVQTHG